VQGIHHLRDRRGIDEWLVSLNIHDDGAVQVPSDFCDSISAGLVCRGCHPRDAAEAQDRVGDALIVGCDDHSVNAASLGRATIHVFDHRATGDVYEWFSGKASRRVAGGDDGD